MRQLRYLVVFAAVSVCFCHGQQYVPSGGPVYVNPASQQAQPAAVELASSNDEPALLTQTVYGFLDFTTTIGNTVMVFSPQSKPPVPEIIQTTTPVIETRPPTTAASPITIKPSKITEKRENAPEKRPEVKVAPVLSSIVQVVEAPASSVVEIRQEPASLKKDIPVLYSKVEVREGSSQVVNIVQKEEDEPQRIFSSVVQVIGGDASKIEETATILSSVVKVITSPEVVSTKVNVVTQAPIQPVIFSSHVEVIAGKETVEEPAIQGNNIVEPEYDFLSRQPSEVVDETYRVINLRPSSKFHLKPRSSARAEDAHPTGLITRMGGTIVKDGLTTIHETKVIGTFVSGRYTQLLQSSSKIKPSATAKVLKTAGPNFGKGRFPHIDPTQAGSNYEETVALPLEALFSSPSNVNQIRGAKQSGGTQRNRFNIKNKLQDSREQDFDSDNEDEDDIDIPSLKKQAKPVRPTQSQQRAGYRATKGYSKPGRSSPTASPELTTVSVYNGDQSSSRRYTQQRRPGSFKSQAGTTASPPPPENSFSRRGFKPKFQASPVENERTTSTSLYKFKLARPPGRWSYKTTPKPRVTIRKQDEGPEVLSATSPSPQFVSEQRSELRERTDDGEENDEEFEGDVTAEVKQVRPEYREPVAVAETIKVQISTPADFKDVYYEIATIRSPYTFQVGTVKNTRFITVTSTIEKSLIESTAGVEINPSSTITEPLTENILSTLAPHYTHTLPLDSSIATLPPIALASDMETPPLETLTETFSTTQQLLKTHILPVVRHGSDTQLYTLVQSYNVTRFVTAIKTLPPMEAYHFHPSRTLTDLNTRLEEAGSELHLELEFGDDNESDEPAALRALRPDIDLANVGSELDISDLDKLNLPDGPLRYKKTPEPLPKIASLPKQPEHQTPAPTPQYTQEQLQQLALLRFLNPAAAASLPQFVTSSRPVLKLETVYESHVLPLFDGVTTHYSTLSRPVGTVTKTEYEYVTSTVQPLPNINQLFQQQPAVAPPQFQLTSTPVVTQTMVTETQSKVLKLTFGAKTQFTTIYSTKVVPTVLTTYVTASIPVQQQPAFNPYFAPQFQQLPQFPYIG